jgi:hypothetical protein
MGRWVKGKEPLPNEVWYVIENGKQVAMVFLYRDKRYEYDSRGIGIKEILSKVWVISIVPKNFGRATIKTFGNKKTAKKYAINWMKKHPKG